MKCDTQPATGRTNTLSGRPARWKGVLCGLLLFALFYNPGESSRAPFPTAQSVDSSRNKNINTYFGGTGVQGGGASGQNTQMIDAVTATKPSVSSRAVGGTNDFATQSPGLAGMESPDPAEAGYPVAAPAIVPTFPAVPPTTTAVPTVPPITNNIPVEQSADLAWNVDASPHVAGYKVYYGGASGQYTNMFNVGNVTNATVSGLAVGTTYYFAATAYDFAGGESCYSAEVSYTVGATAPPTLQIGTAAPGQFALTLGGPGGSTVNIEATQDLVVWVVIGTVTFGDSASSSFADTNVAQFAQRFYRTEQVAQIDPR